MSELPPNQPPNGPPNGPSDGPPTVPDYQAPDGPPTVPDYQPPDGPPTVPGYQQDPTFASEPGFGPVPEPQPPSWGPTPPSPTPGPPTWRPEPQPAQTGGGKPLPLIIGGLVLLVATAIGGAFLLTRDDNGSENTANTGNPGESGVDTRPPDEEDPEGPGTDDPGTDDPTTTTEPETTTTDTTEPPTTTTTEPDITTTAGSPEDAVYTFFDAFTTGDCYTVVDFASASVVEDEGGEEVMLEDCEQSLEDIQGLGTFTLDDATLVDQSDDTATVEITMTVDVTGESESQTDTVDLVLEDGGWKFTEW